MVTPQTLAVESTETSTSLSLASVVQQSLANPTNANPATATLAESSGNSSTDPQTPERSRQFYLRFATRARPFNLPTWSEVTAKGMEHFTDPGLRCPRKRFGAEFIYMFQLTKPVPVENQFIKFVINGEELSFELTLNHPFERRVNHGNRNAENATNTREREEGILITFQNAGLMEYDSVPSSDFDKAMAAFNLQLIVSTRMQPVPGVKGSFNGNRYCVIRIPESTLMVPEYLPVRSSVGKFNFKSTYKNQARQCDICWVKHIGQCPKRKAMFEAKEEKEKMRGDGQIESKLFSDSTLRLANSVGMKADICTMSGGGLGQVVQAALDDPDAVNMKEIYVVAGANDVKFENFQLKEFCENVEVSLNKVQRFATMNPDKSITVVTTPPSPQDIDDDEIEFFGIEEDDDPDEDNDTTIKKEYLQRRIRQMVTQSEEKNIHNVWSMEVRYDVDNTGHPTPGGTTRIMEQIAANSNKENFIWNSEFVSTDKLYSMVQSIYVYGCNMCDKYGVDISRQVKRCRLLCDSCYEIVEARANSESYPLLDEILKEFQDLHNEVDWPSIEGEGNEKNIDGNQENNDMTDADSATADASGQRKKRVHSTDEEGDDAKRTITSQDVSNSNDVSPTDIQNDVHSTS